MVWFERVFLLRPFEKNFMRECIFLYIERTLVRIFFYMIHIL